MNRLLHFELKCPPVSDSNTLLSGFARPDTGQDKSSNEGHRIAPFQRKCRIKVISHLFGVFEKSKRATTKSFGN